MICLIFAQLISDRYDGIDSFLLPSPISFKSGGGAQMFCSELALLLFDCCATYFFSFASYSVTGFIDKNKDTLFQDFKRLMYNR